MAAQGTYVEFFNMPVLHGIESKAAGREIYVSKPHVRIRVAGNDKEVFVGPANEQRQKEFPAEWAAFLKGEEVPIHGTPLERWPQLTPERVANLKVAGFRTVEDIAQAPDFALQQIGMGAYALQKDARKFLSLAQSAADLVRLEKLEAERQERDDMVRTQAEQIKQLQEQIATLMESVKPEETPKRKRKEPEAA